MPVLVTIFSFFDDYPLLVQLIWIIAFLFFIVLIGLVFYLKTLRGYLRIYEAANKKRKEKFEELLVTYLFAGESKELLNLDQKKIIKIIKSNIRNKYKRKIFVDVLVKLMDEVSGELNEKIQKLYIELDLVKFAASKLHSKNWHIIAIGIRDLSQFKIAELESAVAKHINHQHGEVRREAHLYFLHVFGFRGLDFLSNLNVSLSTWDQIGFIGILEKFDQQEVPDLKRWLRSENKFVVLFTLKLAKIYNRIETKDLLIKLLDHPCSEVRLNTIKVLDYFYIEEAKDPLIRRFNQLDERAQVAAFNLINSYITQEDEAFIEGLLLSSSFDLKFLALKTLKILNDMKFSLVSEQYTDSVTQDMIAYIEKE